MRNAECGIHSELRTPNSALRCLFQRKGQSLTELAVFGSLLLFLFGVLINYGMNSEFTQHGIMKAFRKALGIAADQQERSGTYVLFRDRHVPSPSDPFGVGSVTPVPSSADATRNYRMYETPNPTLPGGPERLPRVHLVARHTPGSCGGETPCPVEFNECPAPGPGCTTAGFRRQYILEVDLEKYQEIYGANRVCILEKCGATKDCVIGYDEECNPYCADIRGYNAIIMDSCDGEMLGYQTCVRQGRMIVNPQVCSSECQKSRPPSERLDCDRICGLYVEPPWYTVGASRSTAGAYAYNFPVLENQLFPKTTAMGIQPGSVKTTTRADTLQKTERPSVIVNTAALNTTDQTDRKVRYNAVLDGQGFSTKVANPQEPTVSSTVQQQDRKTWTTRW
jgi:hypothetical protein